MHIKSSHHELLAAMATQHRQCGTNNKIQRDAGHSAYKRPNRADRTKLMKHPHIDGHKYFMDSFYLRFSLNVYGVTVFY